MTSSVNRRVTSLKTRVQEHLAAPLFRNGYALAASSAVTSAIGVVYWILATHFYSAEIVGLNSAVISMMMFLGGLAQLNLMTAHIRFIPTAGPATRRFIALTYLVALAMACIISLVYLGSIQLWSPALSFLRSSPPLAAAFVLATMGWTIFVLQDSALTGLRHATWVPVENAVFAVAKIILMILLAFSIPQLGLFLSWLFGLAITLFPTNFFIFQRIAPNRARAAADTASRAAAPLDAAGATGRAAELEVKQVVQYAGADFLGALFWLGATTLLPVMVTQIVGAKSNAYFFLAWQIAYMLHLLSSNMGSSLIVEASAEQHRLNEYSRKILLQLALLVGSAVLVVVVGAPLILRIFGQDYAAQGSSLLRLLALGAIPNIVTSVFVSMSRVRRKMSRVVLTLGALCILVLSLSSVLLRRFGIEGAGFAWLASQIIVSSVILIRQGVKLARK